MWHQGGESFESCGAYHAPVYGIHEFTLREISASQSNRISKLRSHQATLFDTQNLGVCVVRNCVGYRNHSFHTIFEHTCIR